MSYHTVYKFAAKAEYTAYLAPSCSFSARGLSGVAELARMMEHPGGRELIEVKTYPKELGMESLTIRVSRSTHDLLRELASRSNETITSIVDKAARELQKKAFWEDFNASCMALKANPDAWADLQKEDEAWEATLADGLENQSDEYSPKRRESRKK
jgi:hypothetical protein